MELEYVLAWSKTYLFPGLGNKVAPRDHMAKRQVEELGR